MPAAKLKDKATGGLLDARPTSSPSAAKLIGFQAGPYGFVRIGTDDSPTGWLDYLYQIVYGGRGGGKSQGGALRSLKYVVSWPRALGVITAPTLNVIHDATLPALQRVFEQAGIYEDKDYSYNNTREEIKLWNGGTILLRSTEHPQRIRGMDAAWFWMDEPRDSPLEAFLNLQATLRQQGFPHQGWMTTTPLGKYHWTYPLFFPDEATREGFGNADLKERGTGTYIKFFAPTRENPFGGEELYQNLIRTYGVDSPRARQELEGKIVLMEGLVYPSWDAEKYVVDESHWPSYPVRVVAGVDFGFTAPAGVVVEGVDKSGRRYLLDEIYETGLDENSLGSKLLSLKRKYGISYFACDWADPRWLHTLRRRYKLPAVRALKKVGRGSDPSSGIGLCNAALQDGDLGQMFYVSPKMKNFVMEIENYVREDPHNPLRNPDERPRKFMDHLMDSWRYSESFIADHYHRPGEKLTAQLPTKLVTIKQRAQTHILDAMEQAFKELNGSDRSTDAELSQSESRSGQDEILSPEHED